MQGATQLGIPGAQASDRGSTTNLAMAGRTIRWTSHMLLNCAPAAQDQVVTRTCFSWTLSALQSLITATSRTY